ncbi:MAG: hypothetical protein ACOZCL_13110 [Bacillota bacterium]
MDKIKQYFAYKSRQRLISIITLVVYLMTSLVPMQVFAGVRYESDGPTSSTKSKGKTSYTSSTSNYKSSSSSTKSSSSSSSSYSSSYKSSAQASGGSSGKSGSSNTTETKKSGGFFGAISNAFSSAKQAVTSTVNNVTQAVSNTVNNVKQTVTTAVNNVKQTVTTAVNNVKQAVTETYINVKQTVSNTVNNVKKTVTTAVNNVKQSVSTTVNNVVNKAATTVNNAINKVADVAQNAKNTLNTVASNVKNTVVNTYNNVKEAAKTAVNAVATVIKDPGAAVNKLVNGTKTLVSKAQDKIKTAIADFADYASQKITQGFNSVVTKAKDTVTSAWNKTKEVANKIASNPTVQRIAKGAMGALQLAGGVLQVAGGVALSSTGLGAVLGVPVAAHGAGDVVQGGLKLVNAIFGTNIKEVNPVQEAYRAVGGLIGGEKGKAIADKVFGITDLALGFVNVQKAVTNVAKIKNVFNAADKLSALKTFIKQSDTAKFIKNIPQMLVSAPTKAKNLAKNAIDITVNTFNKGRNAVHAAIKGATNLAADATAAVKRFTSSFKNAAASVIGGAKKSAGASDSGLKIDLQLFAKKSADKVDDATNVASKTSIKSARKTGVKKAWKEEGELVAATGRGTRPWTEAEKLELLEKGKVKGYEGHHINSVKNNPDLAKNPDNVKFVRGRKEHLKEHGGNFRNQTSGEFINRRVLKGNASKVETMSGTGKIALNKLVSDVKKVTRVSTDTISTSVKKIGANAKPKPRNPVISKPTPTKPAINKPAPTKSTISKSTPSRPTISKPTPSRQTISRPTPSRPTISRPAPSRATKRTSAPARSTSRSSSSRSSRRR